jgi:hypothetical protein
MNKAHKLLPDVSIIPKDTAGVLFAHGVPGFIGGLAGICATADYQDATRTHHPARPPARQPAAPSSSPPFPRCATFSPQGGGVVCVFVSIGQSMARPPAISSPTTRRPRPAV